MRGVVPLVWLGVHRVAAEKTREERSLTQSKYDDKHTELVKP